MKAKEAASKLEFIDRVRLCPLIAIDLVLINQKNEILLGYRKNSPAKNKWFIPGGSIKKNETLDDAFKRISSNEVFFELNRKDAVLLSIGEHFYKDENAFDIQGIDTHYVVITYQVNEFPNIQFKENDQHFKFKWMSVQELLERDDVHENTKILFR